MRPWRAIAAFAALKVAAHVAVLTPYGWFRDELYYIACSEHLAWGYVDHPPLSIAILRAWRALFGDSLAAVRMGPALAGALVVVVTGMLTMELGGGALAASLACAAIAFGPAFLAVDHVWSMNVFDHLAWAVSALLAVRAIARGTPRAWIALGVALGLGLLNKWSILWLGAGLFVALVASPARRALATPWPYVAAAIAALLFAPHVAWEIRNGWPTLEFMHNALVDKYVPLSPLAFLAQIVIAVNPVTLPLFVLAIVAGARGRARATGAFTLAAIVVVTLAILLLSKGAKPEYLLAAFPMIFATGAAACEAWLREKRAAIRWSVLSPILLLYVAFGAVAAPFAVPLLGEEAFVRYQAALGAKPTTTEKKELAELPQMYADMHGWPELVAVVGAAFARLPEADRARATLWSASGGYGPASALDFFGRAHGLPPARCAHNNYWIWGPGDGDGDGDGAVVLVVGGRRERLEPMFASLEEVARFECRFCMPYENHKPIYIGRGMKPTLRERWPDWRYFE